MMEGDYFVMVNHPNKKIKALPLVADDEGNIAWFSSEEAARKAGRENGLGDAYGFEVFQLGNGE